MEKLNTFVFGCIFTAAILVAHEIVNMNQKHWCEVEYKKEPRYVAECTVLGNGIAKVSFK
jgi:hypothetical protein